MPSQMKTYVEDGTVPSFFLWDVGNLGDLSYYVTYLLATGKIKGTSGETFTAGKLGSYTIAANGQLVLGPPLALNKANVSKYNF